MSAPDPNDHGMLRERLKRAADAAPPSPIDVDEVLRRSRAARRTRRTALVGGVGAVAGVLAVTGLVLGLPGLRGPTATDGQSAESSGVVPDSAGDGAAEDADESGLPAPLEMNRCGAPVARATDASVSSLTVTVDAPDSPVPSGATVPVTVTVTNVGGDPVAGAIELEAPLTVAASGITVSPTGAVPDLPPTAIALAPGESTSLPGSFETRDCAAAGDAAPAVAPPLEPGDYALTAVVSYTTPDGTISHLVAPLAPFTVG